MSKENKKTSKNVNTQKSKISGELRNSKRNLLFPRKTKGFSQDARNTYSISKHNKTKKIVNSKNNHTKKSKITVIDYSAKTFKEKEVKRIEECFPYKATPTVSWISIVGLEDKGPIKKIGDYFGVHPLIIEDIMSGEQRPKMEDFGSYIFILFKVLRYCDEKEKEIKSEQVSLILAPNFVISFEREPSDIFETIRQRLKNVKSRTRKSGSDHLAYALIDTVVDKYFQILEKFGEYIEEVEENLLTNPTSKILKTIHDMKMEMIVMRKSAWPLREVINNMQRSESKLIKNPTKIYLRDVYDHIIQVIDNIETMRDLLSGMLDVYLSSISNRLNEVMKVLTIISTIFIPLTFVAGIYGMNFKYMPELYWKWSYPILWAVLITAAVSMLFYFKKRKWL